ncbi:GNAT family N-acetyltransferase [Actinoplanes sp. GCM10030250]|uniref:GNAT family N-acetyltransferase n=1 Tax=Actinoplanes sp. GCM10030250 TaxID=3273376 RepID=UPI00361DE35D
MNERINIVAVPDQPGWRAVTARGSPAGTAGLRPINPFEVGAAELTLFVKPRWRRRGIGSRLLAAVREQTTEPRLVVDVEAGSPGEAFCLRHGFRHTGSRRHDLLIFCDVHQAWLAELIDADHPGYRLIHWTGDLPGHSVLTAAEASGDLAAYAMAEVGAPTRQYGPAVRPGHRGRRLDLWVNAALIKRLRDIHPHITEIETATAEDDHQLLAARRHLGFRPHRRTRLYELALS